MNKVTRGKIPRKGFYIYGRNAVLEVLQDAPHKLAEIFFVQEKGDVLSDVEPIADAARAAEIRLTSIESKRAGRLVPHLDTLRPTQGVIAYYTGFEYKSWGEFDERCADKSDSCVLVLDGIEDVGNFGAIIRSAAACGVDAVFVSDFHQAPVSGGVFKTSAGAINKIDVVQFSGMGQAMENLKQGDYWIYGIDMEEQEAEYPAGNIWQQKFDGRTALIVGSEDKGISAKAKEKCDFLAPIPMENSIESLNVSVAAAVAMYEWKRQQGN